MTTVAKRLQAWADLAACGLVLLMAAVFVWPWAFLQRIGFLSRVRRQSAPRMLQMVSGSSALEGRRNALGRLQNTDYAWFGHVFHLYFYAPTAGRQQLGDRHTLIDWRIPWLEWLRRAGWKRLHLAIHESALLFWMCWLVSTEGIGIVDATDPYVTGINAYLVHLLMGVPYTVEIHRDYDLDYQVLGVPNFAFYPSWQMERRVGSWALRHATRVIGDHQCYTNYAIANGASAKRVTKVRATSNLGRFGYDLAAQPRTDARQRYELGSARLLVYVGRLDPDKFVEGLVPCLERVVARRRDVCLLLAGDGMLRHQILEEASRRGLSGYLRWLGWLSLEQMLDLFASTDVIVGTHLGATYLEAALCGAPMVAYNIDRHPEFITDGETGLLVPFRDPERLADAILRVLDDPGLADRMRRAAKERVLARHLPEHYMEDMRHCFQDVLREFTHTPESLGLARGAPHF